LERNQQAEDLSERHTTTLRCLKDRYTGQATGHCIKIHYHCQTGRLSEVEDTEITEAFGESDDY
jgi:twinkle protein